MSTFLKSFIKKQKTAARKSIASHNTKIASTKSCQQYIMFKIIANERKFLAVNPEHVNSLEEAMELVHSLRHQSLNKHAHYFKCELCHQILAESSLPIPGSTHVDENGIVNEDKIKLKYGNLMDILSKNVAAEVARLQGKRTPSQNDLTRWALKDAVLEFYKDFNEQESTVVVDNIGDDRLSMQFEADFDIIYKKWMERLDRLQRRNDKYTLLTEEYDAAEEDLVTGMRGSNFEKQLDRYRKEFMEQLNAINGQ